MKVLVLAFGIGTAIQAWRNFPADGPTTTAAVQLLFLLGMLAAFLVGRGFRRSGGATAVAVASAEATAVASNTVNVALVVPGAGAGRSHGQVPDETVAWFDGPRQQVDVQQVMDGMDPSELREMVGEVEHVD